MSQTAFIRRHGAFSRLFAAFAACAVIFTAAGCSDDEKGTGVPSPATENHLAMLGYAAGVKSLRVTDPQGSLLLEAEFLPDGRCRRWNDTGVESSPSSRGFIMESAAYTYGYDSRGRLSTVEEHLLSGDTRRYEITYGSHTVMLPSPLRVARFENYPLRGVAAIRADHYTLTCDGRRADAVREGGREDWGSSREEVTYFLGSEAVMERESRTFSATGGEEEQVTAYEQSLYTYAEGRMTGERCRTVMGGDALTVESDYTLPHPLFPSARRAYVAGSDEPVSQIELRYTPQGEPLSVTAGEEGSLFAEQPFEMRYTARDGHGNWTHAERIDESGVVELRQEIVYY